MFKVLGLSACISVIIVFFANYLFEYGGKLVLSLGTLVGFYFDMIILLFSTNEMDWYRIPPNGILIINLIIYTIFSFTTILLIKYCVQLFRKK